MPGRRGISLERSRYTKTLREERINEQDRGSSTGNIVGNTLMLTSISAAGHSYRPSCKTHVPYVEPNQSIFKLERAADLYIPKQDRFQTGASMPDLRQR